MVRTLIVIASVMSLAVPAALAAPPADKGKPDKAPTTQAGGQSEQNAAKKCAAERKLGEDAFKVKYGTNHNKANAFGKCVSKLSKAKSSS